MPADTDNTHALPSPDELLLELIDLTALAFPEPLAERVLTFTATPDGSRPALTDIDGKARPNQPRRPDLGFKEAEVLDGVNDLLCDLAIATDRQGGVRIVEGRLRFDDGDDGEVVARLFERTRGAAADVDGDLVMTRRFDASELRWLFYSKELFARLNETESAEQDLQRSTEQMLLSYQRFEIDMQQATLAFHGPASSSAVWSFEVVGSWAEERHRFLWGWANDTIAHRFARGVDSLRRSSTETGLRAFTDPTFGCPERMAERLARHAVVRMSARGMYRAPFQSSTSKGFLYLALMSTESDERG